jgi:hypothetical protein
MLRNGLGFNPVDRPFSSGTAHMGEHHFGPFGPEREAARAILRAAKKIQLTTLRRQKPQIRIRDCPCMWLSQAGGHLPDAISMPWLNWIS